MSPSAIPKVAVGPTKWTEGLYGTYDGCLAKPELSQLTNAKPPAHVLTSAPDLAAAIHCMTEHGDIAQCTSKFDDLKIAGGYKAPEEPKGMVTKVMDLHAKAGT